MTIIFQSVTARNFFSVGDNPIKIQLNRSPTTLIRGQNGASKSSLFADALFFGLFKKSFRGLTLDRMINNINGKGCLVTVEFTIGPDKYVVERGLKPTVFKIKKNDKALDELSGVSDLQSFLETSILGFDANSFARTCIISSMNYKPFMKLSGPERRALTDVLLSTSVFTEMSKLHKETLREITLSIKDKTSDLQKEELKKTMLKKQFDQIKASDENAKESLKEELRRLSEDYKILHAEMVAIEFDANEYSSINNEMNSLEDKRYKVRAEIDSLSKNISKGEPVFAINKKCKECGTEIKAENAEEHYQAELERYNQTKSDIDILNQQYSSLSISILSLKQKLQKMEELKNKKDEKSNELNYMKRSILSLKERYNNLSSKNEDVEKVVEEIQETESNIVKISNDLVSLEEEKSIADVVADSLKDSGIKSRIIDHYIPVLCDRVNYYLMIMNFNLSFKMDSEFNETLVTRFSDEYTYEHLSGGEKQRLDLALIFAWRDIAKMKGSVDTNFLLIDEMLDQALDAQGTEDVMTILGDVCKDQNVFLISHKSNLEDKVFSVIEIYKENGFARIK